jgi:hypothetical protein
VAVAKRQNAKMGFRQWLTPVRIVGLIIGLMGIGASVFGELYKGEFAKETIEAFYPNFGMEFISIAITVIVIDWLYERRDERREKERLIRQMRSKDNGLALQAVEELRACGWLRDGSLRSVSLFGANLQEAELIAVDLSGTVLTRANLRLANLQNAMLDGADLTLADLSGANLSVADLRHACLVGAKLNSTNLQRADLEGADLTTADLQSAVGVTDAQLARMGRLWYAIMVDGGRYNEKFNLTADLEFAQHWLGVDLSDPAALAGSYHVSLEDYLAGQEWARENLPKLHGEG